MSNTISYSKEEADNLFYLKEKGRLLELKVEELGEGVKGSISPSMTTQDLHELDLGIYRAETSGLYQFPDSVVMDIPNETVADNTVPIGYSVLFSKDADGWRLFQAVKMPEVEVNQIIDVTKEYPLSSGYYSLETAIMAIPTDRREFGQFIKFGVDEHRVQELYRYIGATLSNTMFHNVLNWERLNDSSLFFQEQSLGTSAQDSVLKAFKVIALSGNWKGKEIYLRSSNTVTTDGNLRTKQILFNYDNDDGISITIAGMYVTYDLTENKYIRAEITPTNPNDPIEGYAIIDAALLNRYNIPSTITNTSNALLVKVQDLNDYSDESAPAVKVINRLSEIDSVAVNERVYYGNLELKKYGDGITFLNRKQWKLLTNSYQVKHEVIDGDMKRTLCVTRDGSIIATNPWQYSSAIFISDEINGVYTKLFDLGAEVLNCFELGDGELLFVTRQNGGFPNPEQNGIWRTSNFRTTVSQVLQYSSNSPRAYVHHNWGVSIVDNVVVLSEYGSFAGLGGSRYIYYSDDYGKTYRTIFDLHNPPINLYPTPESINMAHIHGVCYDPYWKRIWFVTGDGDNSKLLAWSDDLGETWDSISTTEYDLDGDNVKLQFISLHALEDCIILGPDCPVQYMFRIQRTTKSDTPIIEKGYEFRNQTAITHFPTRYLRSRINPNVLYIPVGYGDQNIPTDDEDKKAFILATTDGISFYKIWENEYLTIYPRTDFRLFEYKGGLIAELEDSNGEEIPLEYKTRSRYYISAPEFA